LFSAIEQDNYQEVRRLINDGADVYYIRDDGATCLHIAAVYASEEIVKCLLSELTYWPPFANARNNAGYSALALAAGAGRQEIVKAMIRAGLSVNGTGKTPLWAACSENAPTCVIELLLINKSDPNAISDGMTCLGAAAYYGRAEVIELLLSRGADPYVIAGSQRLMAVDHAIRRNHAGIALRLLQVMSKDERRDTFFDDMMLNLFAEVTRNTETGRASPDEPLRLYIAQLIRESAEATNWVHDAAERGNRDAQYDLGIRYRDGEGVPNKDLTEAYTWLRKAASQGHPAANDAAHDLLTAAKYDFDNLESERFLRVIAEKGNLDAQYFLGWRLKYISSMMIDQEKKAEIIRESKKWLQLAASHGHHRAQQLLDKLHSP